MQRHKQNMCKHVRDSSSSCSCDVISASPSPVTPTHWPDLALMVLGWKMVLVCKIAHVTPVPEISPMVIQQYVCRCALIDFIISLWHGWLIMLSLHENYLDYIIHWIIATAKHYYCHCYRQRLCNCSHSIFCRCHIHCKFDCDTAIATANTHFATTVIRKQLHTCCYWCNCKAMSE